MEILNLKGTVVLEKHLKAFGKEDKRNIVHQGGTRSSKTYSIAQGFVIQLLKETDAPLTIVRKTMPSLRTSVMRDFFEILTTSELYDPACHNKSESTYVLNDNLVEFISLDQPQKKRGSKRKYLWLNEANELTFEDYMQLNMRTSGKVVLDYNPSDEFHWIYDKIVPREDTEFIQSTYLDNPFLERNLVSVIEDLKNVDANYWLIYGLGEKGHAVSTIFPKWDTVNYYPEEIDDETWGIDFGYNVPSAIVRCGIKDGVEAYIDELLYATKMTNADLIEELKLLIPKPRRSYTLLKADSAEPDRIQEICDAGFYCEPCRKGKGSVKDSIDVVKRFNLHLTKRSVNIQKEIKGYKWRVDKDGNVLDEPVKFKDHAMAGIRYAIGDGIDEIEFIKDSVQGRDRDMAIIGAVDKSDERRRDSDEDGGGKRDSSFENMELL